MDYDVAQQSMSLANELLALCGLARTMFIHKDIAFLLTHRQAENAWATGTALVDTAEVEDRCLTPLAFDYREPDYPLIHYLAYTWACETMLSGLLQALVTYGISSHAPSIAELQEA